MKFLFRRCLALSMAFSPVPVTGQVSLDVRRIATLQAASGSHEAPVMAALPERMWVRFARGLSRCVELGDCSDDRSACRACVNVERHSEAAGLCGQPRTDKLPAGSLGIPG